MDAREFNSAIDATSFRMLALGFKQAERTSLLFRAKRQDGCVLELAGERYDSGMTMSILGDFSSGSPLALALLAKAVSNESFAQIRDARTTRETVRAAVEFLDQHLDDILANPDSALERYCLELDAARNQALSRTENDSKKRNRADKSKLVGWVRWLLR